MEFRGHSDNAFLKALEVYDKMYAEAPHYGRCIPILQSSGTGKSRLVAEVLKKKPGLSICLRPSEDREASWPPRDEAMYGFIHSNEFKFSGEEIAAALLGALFKEVYVHLERHPSSDPGTLMSPWSLGSKSRGESFESVCKKADESLRNMPTTLATQRKEKDPDKLGDWRNELYEHFCLETVKGLSNALNRIGHRDFIIAFDEYLEPSWCQKDLKSLWALRQMIKVLNKYSDSECTFWFLFLGTDAAIADFFRPGEAFVQQLKIFALPPWPYLGFNMMFNSIAKTPREALSFHYLKAYGRPYWSTLDATNLLSAAREKLYMSRGPCYLNPSYPSLVLATFSQRFPLDLATDEAGAFLAAYGVCRHMRLLRGINGSLIGTMVPSEPALAIAAMKELVGSREVYKKAVQTLVDELIRKGHVFGGGSRGELFSHILLTIGRDMATRFSSDQEVPIISAKTFLTTLLGDHLGLDVQNPDRPEFLKEMGKTYLNFTRIVQLEKDCPNLSFDFLCQAWCNGTAIQLKSSKSCVEGFIVTYNGDLDRPFEEKAFSYIAWKSKLRSLTSDPEVVSALTGPRIGGRKPDSTVVLFMDFTDREETGPLCQLTYEAAQHPKVGQPWGGYMPTQDEEPRRWCISARGFRYGPYPLLYSGFGSPFYDLYSDSPDFLSFIEGAEEEMDPFTPLYN